MNAVAWLRAADNDPVPCDEATDFADELARLDRLIEREMRRLRSRYELSLDEFRGLYVSDEQVDALVRAGTAPQEDAFDVPAPPVPVPGTRWARLQAALGLTRQELDLVLLALAPEIDPKYETLCAYLHNDVTRKLPSGELAQRLFGTDAASRLSLRARLAPEAPLLAQGVLDFVPATRELPRPQRGLRVPAALVDWLLGLPYQDERLAGCVEAAAVPVVGEPPGRLAQVPARADGEAPVLVLTAADAAEAVRAALQAAQGGPPAWRLDLHALKAAAQPLDVVNALLLMQSLLGGAVVAGPLEALLDAEHRVLEQSALALRRLARRARPLLLAGAAGGRWRDVLGDGGDVPAVEVPVTEPDAAARAAAWRAALAAAGQAAAAQDEAAVLALADRFVLGVARIEQALRHALDLARAAGGPLSPAHLVAACRAVSVDGSASVVRAVAARHEWSDLVVPSELQQRLRDLVHAVELRPLVLDRWNFARPCGGQRGLKALFAGASGTGKTMAAGIVARELGLELHRVELAAVMSKYIGETEKNLERAFAAARRANAILFIDEADALLGKRSEVKDAHDRYANVETAFLLQQMEDHDGVVIVATNLANHIDPAFSRRMQFVLQFPMPDAASRRRLWEAMLPAPAPRGADLDLGFLARQFAFAGGDIRTIALDAAFRAAHAGTAIGMRELLGAVAAHYAKHGKVAPASEFGAYAQLLRHPAGTQATHEAQEAPGSAPPASGVG